MFVFSVKDLGAQCFSRPQFFDSVGRAQRAFMDEVNRPAAPGGPSNDLFSHPDDFELYQLGEFDDSNGQIFPLKDGPKLISQAKLVKLADQPARPHLVA